MKSLIKLSLILLSAYLVVSCSNPERQKADAEKSIGTVQETVGDMTNNDEMKSEGEKNKLKGDLRNTKEDVKDYITNN